MTSDATLELLVRKARMDAAAADSQRGCSPAIAALAAGDGAELVARQQAAREVLAARLMKRCDRRSVDIAISLLGEQPMSNQTRTA